MRRASLLIALVVVPLLAGGQPARPPLSIAVGGLCQDYLEACGCGGRNAGGLARRAAILTQWRAETAGAKVLLEAGDLGQRVDRLPVIARCLARLGVDVVALTGADLAAWSTLSPALADHSLAVTSLAAPAGVTVPSWRVVEAGGGWKVGVIAVPGGLLAGPDLRDAVAKAVKQLRGPEGCQVVVLFSDLGADDTSALQQRLAADERPTVVALDTDADFPTAPSEKDGVIWLGVARRGRSVSVVDVPVQGLPQARAMLVEDGPHDPVIEVWVDEYYRHVRDGETTASPTAAEVVYPRPAACVECHGRAVNAWRRHPHSQAVATLEQRGRDVAGCLRCHDETFRRAGVRPAASGDRGVQCATCHQGLEAHLKSPRTARPTALDKAGCETCHTAENSPHWDYERYRTNVLGACRGNPQPRLTHDGGGR